MAAPDRYTGEKGNYNIGGGYADLPGFADAYNLLADQQGQYGSSDRQGVIGRINTVADQFKQQFTQAAGRSPTPDEMSTFLSQQGGQLISRAPLGRSENDTANINSLISQYTQGVAKSANPPIPSTQPSVPTVPPPTNTPSVPGSSPPTATTPPLPSIPGMPPAATGDTPGSTAGLPLNVPGMPPPAVTATSQLPTILGLTTPSTPVNQPTIQNTDISPYIPTTSQQQQDIVSQSINQSQGVANQNVQSLQDILGPYVQSQVKNWTDPNSPDYQATIGALNNSGRADAGTFSQSLASRLAPLIGQNMMSLGTNALQPSFTTQQGLVNSGAGTQSSLSNASLQRFIDQQNFNQQAALSNELASKGQPSSFQNALGSGASLLSGLGNFGQGASGIKQLAGTWICTHLKKLGLATLEEVERVHVRLRPSIFRHPLHWIVYLISSPRLIVFADAASVDWEAVKKVLIDQVLAEPDSEKAWKIYRAECQRLTLQYAPELWTLEVVA